MTKCGKVNPSGTPYECLRAGIFVGKQTGDKKATARKVKAAVVAGEAAATARSRKTTAQKIKGAVRAGEAAATKRSSHQYPAKVVRVQVLTPEQQGFTPSQKITAARVAGEAAEAARHRAKSRKTPEEGDKEAEIQRIAALPAAEFLAMAIRAGFESKTRHGHTTLTSGSKLQRARKIYDKLHR